jgi:aryl-alcohol dehydrogenase-like predicted oxidoreductase
MNHAKTPTATYRAPSVVLAVVQTRKIGSLEASVVGLGCNNFGWGLDEPASANVIAAALDAGVTFFDTADTYGKTKSEEYLGRALGARRKDVLIATKFGSEVDETRKGARPEYVRRAAEDSLRRLGTDYIDLYQLHKPDPDVPIAETLGALDELVKAGKVREIGCSNFTVEQLAEAKAAVKADSARFASVQNEYSLFHRDPEAGVLDVCAREAIAFLPYFPLANGLLTGKYRRGQAAPTGTRVGGGAYLNFQHLLTEQNLEVVEKLVAFAEAREHTLLELAFAWLLAHRPVVSVIAGATKAEQVKANARAAGWTLSEADLAEIDGVLAEGASPRV